MAPYKPKYLSTFQVEISSRFPKNERAAIAEEIINYVVETTKSGVSPVTGRAFAGNYSRGYAKSLDFKIAHKNKNKIDLTLTGDMLGVVELIDDNKGKLLLGIDHRKFPQEAAKAEGNQLGTYGNATPVVSGRKFLGITNKALKEILSAHPIEKPKSKINEKLLSALASVIKYRKKVSEE
jgi:hypothetical protein